MPETIGGGAIYAIDIQPPDLRYGTSSTGFLESIPISLSIMPSYALYVPYVPYVSYVLFFYVITPLRHYAIFCKVIPISQ